MWHVQKQMYRLFSVCSNIIIRPRFIVTCPTSVSSLLCWRIHPIADGFLSFVIKQDYRRFGLPVFRGRCLFTFFRWNEENVSAAVSGSACRMGSHAVCPWAWICSFWIYWSRVPFKKYGFRDFILRFGGKQMSSRRWFHVRWNWLNRLLTKIYV